MKGKEIYNKGLMIYVWVTLLCYVFGSLAPVVSVIKFTPFYSYQRYLGIIGMLLILADIMINRSIYRKNHVIFLYILMFAAGVSSLKTMEYGIKDNIFGLAWMLIPVYLFYSLFDRYDKEVIERTCRRMYYCVSTIWLLSIVGSLGSFLFNTGFGRITNPYNVESLTRQGFSENRFFGSFMSINVAAIISGIIIIASICILVKGKKVSEKVFSSVQIFFNLVYVILSGSRTGYLGLIVVCFIFGVYYTYYKVKDSWHVAVKFLTALVSGVCISFAFVFLVSCGKVALGTIPGYDIFKDNRAKYERCISKDPNVKLKVVETEEEEEEEEEFLEREDVNSENISNNRFQIWDDYIGLYKEIGLFGFSPSNYSRAIMEDHPDIYIVRHIKDYNPDMYKAGTIYHPHNTYIGVFVFSGWIGLFGVLAYLLLCMKDCITHFVIKRKNPTVWVTGGMLIVIYCLISGVFDLEMFFVNNILTCIFWLVAGYVMHGIREKK